MCIGPSLVVSLKTLGSSSKCSQLSLFCSYYFGRCSSELAELVPLPHSCGSFTSYFNRLRDFSVTFPPRCYKDFYVNSFFLCTARLWNSLPAECFPLTYNINHFKSRINRNFFPWLLFIQFSSMIFSFIKALSKYDIEIQFFLFQYIWKLL